MGLKYSKTTNVLSLSTDGVEQDYDITEDEADCKLYFHECYQRQPSYYSSTALLCLWCDYSPSIFGIYQELLCSYACMDSGKPVNLVCAPCARARREGTLMRDSRLTSPVP
ncbi:hypothetical protein M758_3G102100 [Ceratodon purpureus]|uniref:Uncharacterized protein n=1 Tax=Ceratodon purpureus TaxID=3225 RepID=A0A8T0IJ73_CERPU|nr:hypothetical protein KC19_3G099200 [Ceratodon purpureus]KAG0622507.1 hypothetical protein M758_3G102100 [Ceratodon purpureus]